MGRESCCISRGRPGLIRREVGACIGTGCRLLQSRPGCDGTGIPQMSWAPDAAGRPLRIRAQCFGAVLQRGCVTARVLPCTSAVTLRMHTLPMHHTGVPVPQQPLAEERSEGRTRACAEGRMHSVLGSGT